MVAFPTGLLESIVGGQIPSKGSLWVFLKIMVPQIIHFNRDFHYKPSILGVPLFLETPLWLFQGILIAVQSVQAGKRKTFQPHDVDQIDPSLKLVRWETSSGTVMVGDEAAP